MLALGRSPGAPVRKLAGVRGIACVPGRPQLDHRLAQLVEFAAQIVASDDLANGQPQRGELTREVFGVGLRLRGPSAVLLQRDPVPVLLAILGQRLVSRRPSTS